MKNAVLVIIGIVVVLVALLTASHYGAQDRSFDLKDEVTGKVHSVTERSMEACKNMPHYSIVKLDGVERRCIKEK